MQEEYTMEKLEEQIGYHFQDKHLLQQALTHTSYTNERKINKIASYERLEFLGDAVLELVSSEALFRQNPELSEGELTKMRAAMVCEPSLAFCARDLNLVPFIKLGKGELYTGGRGRDSISADVMEALIGAIYLDGGMEYARSFIENHIMADLEDKQLFYDSKSTLQELMQGKLKKEFCYEVLDESGPEHHKCFRVQVRMEEEILGEGTGKSKKAAEQQAAYKALLLLRDRGICI